jgi:parallel beta-helix repeat protein
VSGNTIGTTDMGIYHYTTAGGATNITNNIVTGSRFEGVFLDEGSATLTGNTVSGGANYGIQVYSFTGAAGNSVGTVSCNTIQSNGLAGIQLADDDPMDAFVPSISGSNNQISGNATGAENTTAAMQNLENNYWGSGTGPNPPGSGDTLVGPVDAVPFLTLLPPCIACTTNANCANGLACDGTETCNAGTCQAGTAIVCVPGQCEASSTCTEPAGTCVPTAKPDGVLCTDGAACTLGDTCVAGVCTPGPGADSDNDGDCDADEVACGCNGMDGNEVCVLPNRLVGLPGSGVGEVLINWHTPTVRKPSPATDPSCQDVGVCTGGRCTAGRINDLCAANTDCNLPPDTCRVIVNWADRSDLSLSFAKVGRTDQSALFTTSPGCSRKINLPLDPARPSNRLRVKAKGTIDGRLRQDRDTIIYR